MRQHVTRRALGPRHDGRAWHGVWAAEAACTLGQRLRRYKRVRTERAEEGVQERRRGTEKAVDCLICLLNLQNKIGIATEFHNTACELPCMHGATHKCLTCRGRVQAVAWRCCCWRNLPVQRRKPRAKAHVCAIHGQGRARKASWRDMRNTRIPNRSQRAEGGGIGASREAPGAAVHGVILIRARIRPPGGASWVPDRIAWAPCARMQPVGTRACHELRGKPLARADAWRGRSLWGPPSGWLRRWQNSLLGSPAVVQGSPA